MKSWRQYAFLTLFSGFLLHACGNSPGSPDEPSPVQRFTYKVLHVFPHDNQAFTQGLVYDAGVLYESTGRYGQSSLRRVALETGDVQKIQPLKSQFFGEGLTLLDGKLYQLTWLSHTGFVYDRSTFEQLQTFSYPTEGWGLTHDGTRLILSDGTSTLYFYDPQNLQQTGRLAVTDENDEPVTNLNELEYVDGEIYANVWLTDKIAIISPESGRVTGWIDLSGLLSAAERASSDVLNGIAYDENAGRLFVTGKLWPKLFEIELVPAE